MSQEDGLTGEAAFQRFYYDTWPLVCRYLARRVAAAEVEDLASAVYAIAWRRRRELSADSLAWLYRTAHYQVLKSYGRATHAQRLLAAITASPAPAVMPDHQERVAGEDWVRRILEQLKPRDAELLRLIVWESLDVPAAAAVLRCSPNAAHVRLHRIRKRVQVLMAEDFAVCDGAHTWKGGRGHER